MLELLPIELSKRLSHVTTISTKKENKIAKFDSNGIYVETESSRNKYINGEKSEPYDLITYDFIKSGWQEFSEVRNASAGDFNKTRGRSSFLMALFSNLPFVKAIKSGKTSSINLKEFQTDDLPCEQYHKVKIFLDEVITQKYDPKLLSKQIEGNLYRVKSRGRQDSKLLGFINSSNEVNKSLLDKYSQADDKDNFIKSILKNIGYFKVVLVCLDLIRGLPKNDKRILLEELGMFIVRNSKGENLMFESVAKERTHNLLKWLEETHLIDQYLNPNESFFDILNPNDNDSISNDYFNPQDLIPIIKEKEEKFMTFNDLIIHIFSFIKSKGFLYSKEEVINLFLSLKTKPFVILSGISGTGKTKMVQWFAEAVGASEDNGQFALIPVRPDWNDSSDLLGYIDIKGEFKEGPLTQVIKMASNNPNLPYFVLLDEMNLARVEHYFSDILSVMESRKWQNGEIVSSNLLKKEVAGEDLKLPNNLYIIGTVNMDETTHPFSKKVLDRANTIEFNRVELGNLSFLNKLEEVEPLEVGYERFSSKYLHLKDVFLNNKKIVERATAELVKINEVLQLVNAQVGYRVRDEICFYLAYNEEGNLLTFDEALDHCILQKVLPRIAGSDGRVDRVLKELYRIFTKKEYDDGQENFNSDIQGVRYPHSAAKVAEMLRRFYEDGFTSFWIS